MQNEIITGYANAAEELISRYEAVSSEELYTHVAHLLPGKGDRLIDIGAGTGRDAAWFASRGCHVLAVEPVAEFRGAGTTLHGSPQITWLEDSLPFLERTLKRRRVFDFVMLSGVWQHLDSEQRRIAMPRFRTLSGPAGRLLISVRHGPGAPMRPCYPASAEEAIELAEANGFELVFNQSADSIQAVNRAAGVTWTWLVFSAV